MLFGFIGQLGEGGGEGGGEWRIEVEEERRVGRVVWERG